MRDVDGLPMNLRMPEPLAGPPGIQRASAERAEFEAYYNRSDDEFLKYLQKAGQAPDPPPPLPPRPDPPPPLPPRPGHPPPPQTADRPMSLSMPGHGPVAAGSKSKVLDSESIEVVRSIPIDIPYPKLK